MLGTLKESPHPEWLACVHIKRGPEHGISLLPTSDAEMRALIADFCAAKWATHASEQREPSESIGAWFDALDAFVNSLPAVLSEIGLTVLRLLTVRPIRLSETQKWNQDRLLPKFVDHLLESLLETCCVHEPALEMISDAKLESWTSATAATRVAPVADFA
jgi:hypothetical protein